MLITAEILADAILINLQETFGWSVYDVLVKKITDDYLGNEMDIRTAIVQRPDLFERGFIGLIGPLAEKFLLDICDKIRLDFCLGDAIRYSKKGDFAKYMAIATRSNPY
jgi:hypothetical protein